MKVKLYNPALKCELKFAEEKGQFEGYASVFDSNDYVNDTIKPGAFKETLKAEKPKMFFNHDSFGIPVGSWLDLFEDKKGLYAVGEINLEHYLGPSIYSALKRGDVDGLSIGFSLEPGDFQVKDDGGREISKVKLHEISPVTFPAEPKATITGVKFEDLENIRDLERLLRDEGNFSKKMAVSFLSHCKRVFASDLLNAENEIKALKYKLGHKQAFDSLFTTLNKLGK